MNQISLFRKPDLEHGGETRIGRRKIARPIDPKRALHIVMSTERAQGSWSMLNINHRGLIHAHTYLLADWTGCKIYHYANVGDHIHLVMKGPSRKAIQKFLRVLTARISMIVTGARKGNPKGRFWKTTVFSRVVSWGRDFIRTIEYVTENLIEAWAGKAWRRRARLGNRFTTPAPE